MKKLVILLALFAIITIVFLVFIFLGKGKETTPDITPTPTRVQVSGVHLESSVPLHNATNVPRNQEVSFTFSTTVSESDIEILVGPNTGHAVLYRGKTVVVRPVPLWDAGTPYRITIQYADLSRIPDGVNFTVVGEAPEKLPNTAPNPTEVKQSENLQRDASPDVYLSNYTPYETDSFSITSGYKAAPTGHFAFTVVTKGGASLEVIKTEMKAWAMSHGLTDAQYNSLDITFE